jgi:hypothetical protein
MPSLKTLNRRFLFGGDELQVLSFLYLPGRLLQFFALYGATSGFGCVSSIDGTLDAYVVLTLLNCACSLFLETLILYFSSLGTVIDSAPRHPLSKLISVKILLLIPLNLSALSVGVPVTFSSQCFSTSSLPKLLQVLLWASQVMEFVFTSCCFRMLRGRRADDPGGNRSRFGTDHVEGQWENCCRFLCSCSAVFTCFLFGGSDSGGGNDYAMVARVLADYFEDGGKLDIVPSDVAAGIVTLRHVQKCREWQHRTSRADSADHKHLRALADEEAGEINKTLFGGGSSQGPDDRRRSAPVSPVPKSSKYWYRVANRPTLDRNSVSDRVALEEAARFARHALAIYTWMLCVHASGICWLSDTHD